LSNTISAFGNWCATAFTYGRCMSVQTVATGGALPWIEARGDQSGQAGLRPIFGQADHLTVHEIREHGVELLRLAAVNLVGSEIPGTSSRTLAVPVAQECVLRSTGFPPTDAVADGRMRGRHRLTVHADLLPQTPRDPRLRIGELDPFGANAAVAALDASLPIHQRDGMRRPRDIVPRPVARRSHTTRAATTTTAWVAPDTAALDPDRQPAVDGVHPRCWSSPPETPASLESTYNRAAIPPVLPCCLHIKRR